MPILSPPGLTSLLEQDHLISFVEQDQSGPGCIDNQTSEHYNFQSDASDSEGALKAQKLPALKPQEPVDTTSFNPFADV